MTNRTFAIIKPDAVKNNYVGKIYNHILKKGFKVLSAKLIKMSKYQAQQFYFIHKDKPFYNELTTFIKTKNALGVCSAVAARPTPSRSPIHTFVAPPSPSSVLRR